MAEIPVVKPGDAIQIRDVDENWHPARATSRVERGRDFLIVWVERRLSGGGTDVVPWPADAVRLDDDVTDPADRASSTT
jgi:hypothetical protein